MMLNDLIPSNSLRASSLQIELQRIISEKELSVLFQPIYQSNPAMLIGFEAFIRGPDDSYLHSPESLFDVAKSNSLYSDLELVSRELSCLAYKKMALPGKLFLNVTPTVLSCKRRQKDFIHHLTNYIGIQTQQLVLEISELQPLKDCKQLNEILSFYRSLGIQIAIDDLGVGYSGMKTWLEVKPDYVKIDKHFIAGIDKNEIKIKFVKSIIDMASSMGCKVIAEAVETKEELASIRRLGINWMQGFLLSRPKSIPDRVIPDVLSQKNTDFKSLTANRFRSPTAESMLNQIIPLKPEWRAEDVAEFFHKNEKIYSLPVVENDKPVGIVTRHRILNLFSGRYFRELHGKKPIYRFMTKDIIVVDAKEPIDKVSQKITNDPDKDLGLDFIITKNGSYLGVGKVRSLLQSITQQELRAARYSNPLTMMPGNVHIDELINDLLDETVDFRVAYFDINNFKPFNDVYGYSLGDEVIITLGQVLQNAINPEKDLAGHIGGDDFVVIFQSEDWLSRTISMQNNFRELVKKHYRKEDLLREGLYSENRKGEKEFFKLLTVCAGVIHPDSTRCHSYHEVSNLAAEAKKKAKQAQNGYLYISPNRVANNQLLINDENLYCL